MLKYLHVCMLTDTVRQAAKNKLGDRVLETAALTNRFIPHIIINMFLLPLIYTFFPIYLHIYQFTRLSSH